MASVFMPLWFGFFAIFVNGWGTVGQRPRGIGSWGGPGLDFFFSRAIDRRVWFAVKTALFALVVTFPSVYLAISHHDSKAIRVELPYMPHPDLLLSLYHRGTESTEAARDLAGYRAAFPSSTIIQLPHENHSTLRLPLGETWEALWFLWQAILLGLLLEGATLIRWRASTLFARRIYALVALIPVALILTWKWIGSHVPIDRTFFFFVQHVLLVALATAAAFALLQWWAWKRIGQAEVN
jgi:hypothetical protein